MQAKFTQGSILKHICVMTFSSATGILLLFFVDVMDIFWLSLLGEVEIMAALGFAGAILFFSVSIGIGLSIACSAVLSQAIGEGQENIKTLVGSVLCITFIVTLVFLALALALLTPVLGWMGANDQASEFARNYMLIILPTMPLLTLSMAGSGVMRAFGHAKKAMYITLVAGAVNAVLDPVFIFGLGWGIEGAAVATSVSRIVMICYAFWQIVIVHEYFAMPSFDEVAGNFKSFFEVALPALITNMATPLSYGYVTTVMASFGDAAVAGNTVLTKVQPMVFAGLFALSGAVGPIVGQNFGAKRFDRIEETLQKSILFILLYCLVACTALVVLDDILITVFKVEGVGVDLIRYFCLGLSTIFFFNGISFSTTAFFNNLRLAHWATFVNLLRATALTMPFAYFGAKLGGPIGIWVGLYVGAVIAAVFGLGLVYYKIKSMKTSYERTSAVQV